MASSPRRAWRPQIARSPGHWPATAAYPRDRCTASGCARGSAIGALEEALVPGPAPAAVSASLLAQSPGYWRKDCPCPGQRPRRACHQNGTGTQGATRAGCACYALTRLKFRTSQTRRREETSRMPFTKGRAEHNQRTFAGQPDLTVGSVSQARDTVAASLLCASQPSVPLSRTAGLSLCSVGISVEVQQIT